MVDRISRTIMYLEDNTLQESQPISANEKEVAQTILSSLKGLYIIRAEKILEFCKLAIKITEL